MKNSCSFNSFSNSLLPNLSSLSLFNNKEIKSKHISEYLCLSFLSFVKSLSPSSESYSLPLINLYPKAPKE